MIPSMILVLLEDPGSDYGLQLVSSIPESMKEMVELVE